MAFLVHLSVLFLIASVHASPLIESGCEWRVVEDWGKPTYVNVATNDATYTKPTACEPEPLSNEDPLNEAEGVMNHVTMQAQTTARAMTFMPDVHTAWEQAPSNVITLALQADITRVRNGALDRLASQWQGPISVAVLTDSVDKVLNYMAKDATPAVKKWTNIHAVVTPNTWKLYPINRMRNYSIKPVKTDYVLVLDIDEHLPYPMSTHLDQVNRARAEFPQRSVFVLASWQWAIEYPPQQQPRNIQELSALVDRGQASIKHPDYPAAYEIPGVDLNTWRGMNEAREMAYPDGFEPYFIARKKSLPEFDERFEGFGGDKSIFFLRVAMEKFHLVLLPHVFTWSSDSPSTSKHHAPNNNLKLMIKAWKEMGRAGGCAKCFLQQCTKNCPALFLGKEPATKHAAKTAPALEATPLAPATPTTPKASTPTTPTTTSVADKTVVGTNVVTTNAAQQPKATTATIATATTATVTTATTTVTQQQPVAQQKPEAQQPTAQQPQQPAAAVPVAVAPAAVAPAVAPAVAQGANAAATPAKTSP